MSKTEQDFFIGDGPSPAEESPNAAKPFPKPRLVEPAHPTPEESDLGDLPKFRFLASRMSMASANRGASEAAAALSDLREAFTPTQPKRLAKLFAGRRQELRRIVSAIEEWKAYVVIYGERGYGKSSLANVVAEIARQGGITVLNCSCTSETTFEEIFRGFLKDIPLPYRSIPGARLRQDDDSFNALLPDGPFGAKELTEALTHLRDSHVIFRIDEFDRVSDPAMRNQLAEAIKCLTDASAQVTFLVVGVAEDLDDLLGKHPSIQRNIVGVHLSLMPETELRQLINAGEKASGLQYDPFVKDRIVALSRGLPYQAQLLCLHCGQAAISRGSTRVEKADLLEAVTKVSAIAPPAVERSYTASLAGSDKETERAVACAAALCACDLYGYFTLEDLAAVRGKAGIALPSDGEMTTILEGLASSEGGSIVKTRLESGQTQYGFSDPVMRPYILAREAAERGLV
ncbi:MAG: ATP-binding protein [Pseudomonadota bacterium]